MQIEFYMRLMGACTGMIRATVTRNRKIMLRVHTTAREPTQISGGGGGPRRAPIFMTDRIACPTKRMVRTRALHWAGSPLPDTITPRRKLPSAGAKMRSPYRGDEARGLGDRYHRIECRPVCPNQRCKIGKVPSVCRSIETNSRIDCRSFEKMITQVPKNKAAWWQGQWVEKASRGNTMTSTS